jgi:ABC-type uncharacterized transport system ATPase subunit
MDQQQTGHVLEVSGLNIFYGSVHAVKDISFSVKPGRYLACLAPTAPVKQAH